MFDSRRILAEAPELGDKMREACSGIMAALENVGEEQERRDNLINEVSLELERCGSDSATGTVTNNSSVRVDITIEVEFLDEANVQLDTGLDFLNGLRPGQTGQWEAHFLWRRLCPMPR